MEWTTSLTVTGYYDDNIEFSPQDPISDYFARISPGLKLKLNFPVLPIVADYTYTRYQYREHSDLNKDFHNLSIGTGLGHGFRIARNLTVDVRDRYEAVQVDVTRPEDRTSNLTQRNTFSISPIWEDRISSQMKLAAGYGFSRVDYTSRSYRDGNYFGHRFFSLLNYMASSRLEFFQSNNYQLKYFSRSPDYSEFLPRAGFNFDLGRGVSLSASGGYSFEETGDKRHEGYVYSFAGNWAPAAKLDLQASLGRRRMVDIEGKPYTEQSSGLSLSYRPVRRLVLDGSARYFDDDTGGDHTRRISLKAGFDYVLNRWSSLNGGYIRDQNVDMPAERSATSNRFYAGLKASY